MKNASGMTFRLPRVFAMTLGAVMLVSIIASTDQARAEAEPFATYTLTARSDVTAVKYFESRTPAAGAQAALVVASPASAGAQLDSLGTSVAFASGPYPGPIIVSLPGTAAGAGLEGIPPYPAYVSSDYPTRPEDEKRSGPYGISAKSQERSTTGAVDVGITGAEQRGSSARAKATTARRGSDLVAEASSDVNSVGVGEMLRVGQVLSLARLTVAAGTKPRPETSFSVGTIEVDGTGVRLTSEGLVLADQNVPVDASALSQQLAEAGIQMRLLPPETGTSPDGSTYVRSGGLEIRKTQAAPDGGNSTYVYTFGQSMVTAASTAAVRLGGMASAGPATTSNESPGSSADTSTDTQAGSSLNPSTNEDIRSDTSFPSDGDAPAPSVAPPNGRSAPVSSNGTPEALALGAGMGELPAATFYPVLVGAALLTLLGSRLIGAFGVRLRLSKDSRRLNIGD